MGAGQGLRGGSAAMIERNAGRSRLFAADVRSGQRPTEPGAVPSAIEPTSDGRGQLSDPEYATVALALPDVVLANLRLVFLYLGVEFGKCRLDADAYLGAVAGRVKAARRHRQINA